MEIKVEVEPDVWLKFERMSGDIGRDKSEVLSEIIEKAYAEFEAKKQKEEEIK